MENQNQNVESKKENSLSNEWKKLGLEVMLLTGTVSQAHKKFKGHNQQGAAIGVVACAFAHLKNMRSWKRETLDKILATGDALYLKSRQMEGQRCKDHLLPPHIHKYFYLGSTQVSMKVDETYQRFKILNDSNIAQNLVKHFETFFEKNHQFGILVYHHQYLTFWQFGDFFFLFDSTEYDQEANRWSGPPGLGVCILLRLPQIPLLVAMIQVILPLKYSNTLTIYPCKVEKTVKINTKPPETLEVQGKKVEGPVKKALEQFGEPQVVQIEPPIEEIAPAEEIVRKVPPESSIPPQKPHLEPTTKYQELIEGVSGILRASTHQNDPKFTKYQDSSNALAALCMLRLHKSKFWNRDILNQILKLGELFHTEWSNFPTIDDRPHNFIIENKKYRPVLDHSVLGSVVSSEPNILSLGEALSNHFLDNDCAFLAINTKKLALWHEDGKFYMFEPNECDEFGTLVKDQNGKACVLYFSHFSEFLAKILANLSQKQHNAYFCLYKVEVDDVEDTSDDWFAFKALAPQKWILRGTFSQKDRRFLEESRNSQCGAMAALALAFRSWIKVEEWNSDTVDTIVEHGDKFYQICVENLRQNDQFRHPHLMIAEIYKSYDIENRRFMFEIDDCLVYGVVNSKTPGILTLQQGLTEFFQNSDGGTVTSNDQSMAIWREGDAYFYFDSHSRDKEGLSCPFGTACVLRTLNIKDLTQIFLSNLKADHLNLFNISRIDVKIVEITDEGFVKPSRNNYDELNDFTTILRSNFSQKHQKFGFLNIGKQTVPNCLAALAMNMLIPSEFWRKEDVDQILNFGDRLYSFSMAANYVENVPCDEINTTTVQKQIVVGSNFFEFEFGEHLMGNFEENLRDDLGTLEVFEAVLESPLMTVALWRDDNTYYLFDPQPRDERGQVFGKDGWSAKIEEIEASVTTDQQSVTTEVTIEEANVEQQPEESVEVQIVEEPTENIEELAQMDEGEDVFPPPVEKKDSLYWRIQEEQSGKACVLRFGRFEDLVTHLVENIPPNKRQSTEFELKSVTTTNTPFRHEVVDSEEEEIDEMIIDWYNFTEIDRGRWIMRGSRSMFDRLYPESNRGNQEIPMSMMSLAFVNLYNMKWFEPDLIDNILDYGDRLLTVLKRLRKQQFKELHLGDEEINEIISNTSFDVVHYPVKICIYRIAIRWGVELGVTTGDTTSQNPDVFNLETGLGDFFDKKQFGLLQCNTYTVAVWQIEDYFYMFDSHPCGPSGVKSPMGVSCITRFTNLEDLASLYLKNLPKIGEHFFVIHGMTFEVTGECPKGFPPLEPVEGVRNLGGFTSIMLGKCILRGGVKHKCENFSRGVHNHSATIGVVALALGKIRHPLTWTKLIIDEILKYGEELYFETLERLGDKFDPWRDILELSDTNNDFQIGIVKINWTIPSDERIWGKVDVKNSDILNLRQGFEKFFERYTRGVLLVQRFKLAVWKQCDDEFFYMFDPNSRGATGLPTHGGTACVLRFHSTKIGSDHVIACLSSEEVPLIFLFVPIEMITKTVRSPKKRTCRLEMKTLKPVTCPKWADKVLQNQTLERAIHERVLRSRQKSLTMLARMEMYQINSRESIVRGVRPLYPNSDLSVNYIAFTYFLTSPDLDSWSWYHIEMVLQLGKQLHIDSIVAYKLPEKRLSIFEVLRTFECGNRIIKLKVHKPIVVSKLSKFNVVKSLESVFLSLECFLFVYCDWVVTLCLKSGFYYMFDPYNRDLNGNRIEEGGSAVMMKFSDVDALTEKIVHNFGGFEDEEEEFVLLFLEIGLSPVTSTPKPSLA
ncbi:uncharacterized protein LOC123009011 [Tribolium madens]|uniref:uncharacterized protein LOC123009011 n=1 Tax=Tribolium madens TaxID=41895 RepID=UPI001CF75EE3|nr:uncharacterized protein LOC123009011 [Tribolium madens]